MLKDNHGRIINYMRLAVTDRCNLRCFYCMPENGIRYMNRSDLLSFEEMHRMIRVFAELGISKIRITGGEPFVRKGIIDFMEELPKIEGIEEVHLTTNGTFTRENLDRLVAMGVKSVNLSLDSLDKDRFFEITRSDVFDTVRSTLDALIESPIKTKVNMVVMEDKNIEDIYSMLELTRYRDLNVRFIEQMPFNGTPGQGNPTFWPMRKILEHIDQRYDYVKLPDPPSSTSYNYQVKGFKGSFGVIAAYTRTFCGTCNRIRITPQGDLRTCLYAQGALSLRDIMRSGKTDEELKDAFQMAIMHRAKDGFEAEQMRATGQVSESMATIGG